MDSMTELLRDMIVANGERYREIASGEPVSIDTLKSIDDQVGVVGVVEYIVDKGPRNIFGSNIDKEMKTLAMDLISEEMFQAVMDPDLDVAKMLVARLFLPRAAADVLTSLPGDEDDSSTLGSVDKQVLLKALVMEFPLSSESFINVNDDRYVDEAFVKKCFVMPPEDSIIGQFNRSGASVEKLSVKDGLTALMVPLFATVNVNKTEGGLFSFRDVVPSDDVVYILVAQLVVPRAAVIHSGDIVVTSMKSMGYDFSNKKKSANSMRKFISRYPKLMMNVFKHVKK